MPSISPYLYERVVRNGIFKLEDIDKVLCGSMPQCRECYIENLKYRCEKYNRTVEEFRRIKERYQ